MAAKTKKTQTSKEVKETKEVKAVEVQATETTETKELDSNNEIMQMLLNLQSQIEELKENNVQLKKENEGLKQSNSINPTDYIELIKQVTQNLNSQDKVKDDNSDINRIVTVIHMDDLAPGLNTVVEGDQKWNFTRLGDKHRIRYGELDKIMSKYHSFFKKGILIIAEKDVHDNYPLPEITPLSVDQYNNLYKLSVSELEKLYTSLCPSYQETIIRLWYNKCYEKDQNYLDYAKLELLDRLSGGRLKFFMREVLPHVVND
jgi:hypothetical protein